MNDGSCCKIHYKQDHVLFVNLLNNKRKDNSEKGIVSQEDENLVTSLMKNIETCVGLFNGGFTPWRDRLPAEGGIFREQVTTFFNQYLWLNNIFRVSDATISKPYCIRNSATKTPCKLKMKGYQRRSKFVMNHDKKLLDLCYQLCTKLTRLHEEIISVVIVRSGPKAPEEATKNIDSEDCIINRQWAPLYIYPQPSGNDSSENVLAEWMVSTSVTSQSQQRKILIKGGSNNNGGLRIWKCPEHSVDRPIDGRHPPMGTRCSH